MGQGGARLRRVSCSSMIRLEAQEDTPELFRRMTRYSSTIESIPFIVSLALTDESPDTVHGSREREGINEYGLIG